MLYSRLCNALAHANSVELSPDEVGQVLRWMWVLKLIANGHRLSLGIARECCEKAGADWRETRPHG